MVFGGGKDVVAAVPTFTMLADYAIRNRGRVEWVALDGNMRLDLSRMESRVTDNTGAVYVCNPNNPTGTIVDPDDLRGFVSAVSRCTTVLVDEAYIDLTDEPQRNSMADQVKAGMNVIVSRTFSEVYGMAGLRVGYGLGRPDIISRLEQRRISIPNLLGTHAALASYGDDEFLARSREVVRTGIARAYRFFDEMSLRYLPIQGNFILFDTGRPSADFYHHMRDRNVLVAPMTEPLDSWVRVSIGRLEHMDVFVDAARSYFQKT